MNIRRKFALFRFETVGGAEPARAESFQNNCFVAAAGSCRRKECLHTWSSSGLEAVLVFIEQRIELLRRNLSALLSSSGLKRFGSGEKVEFVGLVNVDMRAEKLIETVLAKIRDDRRAIRTWRSCVGSSAGAGSGA